MSVSVISAAVTFRKLVRNVDVDLFSGGDCAEVAEELARVEKTCAAVRAMAAARAADCGAHRGRGFGDADDWMAGITGSSRQQAKSERETGERLGDCPETKDAALEGDLSLGQAGEITKTEKEKPGSEGDLVRKAKTSTRQQLADACRKRRQEGADRDELARKQRSLRSLRTWTDGDGMVCGQFRLEPVVGVPLMKRVQDEADRLHREARRSGSTEPWAAHAADALANLLGAGFGGEGGVGAGAGEAGAGEAGSGAGGGGSVATKRASKTRADVVFVVDLRTYRHGQHDETVCHVMGGGPVAPDVVREMAKDAFLKVVFHDGVNIQTVTHLGRYIPAELRTALELGDAPGFEGIACSGCGRKFHLQWDHIEPVCAGGVTSYANEDPKCWDCHAKKCEQERAAGLYERRRSRAPDGPRPSPEESLS
ncbi:MAG: DUF222 domain-containing protein [Actinobacteria bacterium]|nr:DUF222 domain-containing protein [Actinomycetota bacterium]